MAPRDAPRLLLTLDLGGDEQRALLHFLHGSGVEPILSVAVARSLETVDIAWIPGDLSPEILDLPGLAWVHCGHAGIEGHLPPGAFRPGLAITSASGRSTQALAEHALYLMMDLAYGGNALRRYRRWRLFRAPPPDQRRALWRRTVGIVGLGHVGTRLADICSALGMRVLGFRRRDLPAPASVERCWSLDRGDRIAELAGQCEFLVLTASLNDRSHHIVDAEALAALPQGAFLVNIGRGGLLDQAALLRALDGKHLGGAALDVFDEEPLRPSSPLWTHPRIVMSPHRVPRQIDRDARHRDLLERNLDRFRRGEPLLNRIEPADAYTLKAPRRPWSMRDRLWAKVSGRFGPR
jgi:phosphoglycerate dehydrogenase-like enzyme